MEVIHLAQDGLLCDSALISRTIAYERLLRELKVTDSLNAKLGAKIQKIDSLVSDRDGQIVVLKAQVKAAKVKWYWWPVVGLGGFLIGKAF